MKIKFFRVSRYPDIPLFAAFILGIWLILVCVATIINFKLSKFVDLCLFKRFTGYPCPTCGTTRGVISLLQGNFVKAWFFNPLVFSIGVIIVLNLLFRFIFARKIKITLTKKERKFTWLIAIILLLVNWAYIIYYIG